MLATLERTSLMLMRGRLELFGKNEGRGSHRGKGTYQRWQALTVTGILLIGWLLVVWGGLVGCLKAWK